MHPNFEACFQKKNISVSFLTTNVFLEKYSNNFKPSSTSLCSKHKKEGKGREIREKQKRETGEERREGSACNQSPLNALPPTFQNCVKIASSVIDLSCWNVLYNISWVNEAGSKQIFMEHF